MIALWLWGCASGQPLSAAPPVDPPAAVAAVPVDAGTADWRVMYEDFRTDDPVPPFPLIDQDGVPFTLDRYDASYLVLSFVFTRCPMPEACELTMNRLATLRAAWKSEAPSEVDLQILVVTLDPAYDTPAVLRAYRDQFGLGPDDLTMATGDPELVRNALPSLVNIIALPAGPANIQHTVKLVLLGPGREPLASWANNRFTSAEVFDKMRPRDGHAPAL